MDGIINTLGNVGEFVGCEKKPEIKIHYHVLPSMVHAVYVKDHDQDIIIIQESIKGTSKELAVLLKIDKSPNREGLIM